MTKKPLKDLKKGQRFVREGRKGKVLSIGPMGAHVLLYAVKPTKVEIEGKKPFTVLKREQTIWSAETIVEVEVKSR